MRGLRKRLTYANVMSTLAVFAVLGGTAYAANTVFSTDIVNNQVYSQDVRDDTLTNGGLAAVDLKAGSVRSAEVANNSLEGVDIDESTLAVPGRIVDVQQGALLRRLRPLQPSGGSVPRSRSTSPRARPTA